MFRSDKTNKTKPIVLYSINRGEMRVEISTITEIAPVTTSRYAYKLGARAMLEYVNDSNKYCIDYVRESISEIGQLMQNKKE